VILSYKDLNTSILSVLCVKLNILFYKKQYSLYAIKQNTKNKPINAIISNLNILQTAFNSVILKLSPV